MPLAGKHVKAKNCRALRHAHKFPMTKSKRSRKETFSSSFIRQGWSAPDGAITHLSLHMAKSCRLQAVFQSSFYRQVMSTRVKGPTVSLQTGQKATYALHLCKGAYQHLPLTSCCCWFTVQLGLLHTPIADQPYSIALGS